MEVGEKINSIKKKEEEDTYTGVSESRGHNSRKTDKWRASRRRESRAAVEDEVQVRGISHGRRSFGAYSSREEEWTPESFSFVIRDGASCKNPLDPRARDRRAFLALGERIS